VALYFATSIRCPIAPSIWGSNPSIFDVPDDFSAHSPGSMAAPSMFFLLATVAVAAALGMLIARNPVASALWLVLNLFCIAGLYLTLNASFIGVIQILVYAGAIMVLFLFVIMLLNLSALPELEKLNWTRIGGFAVGLVLLSQLLYVVALGLDLGVEPASAETAAGVGSAAALGEILFTRYALHLEVAGILLLAATVGAVMLAQRRFE
jgi:NADH-quinone oxidoreductase subunit J